jgi:uncharacterized protein (TIRG00374 family)
VAARTNPNAGRSTDPAQDMPDELHPRHIAVRVLEVVATILLVAIALTALPGLGEIRARLDDAEAVWIGAAIVAEILSCAGYLLVFRSTFCPRMSWGLSYDIAMAELAANSLLPTGGAGGLALGVWALHKAGMGTEHIARRTVAFFLLTSFPNFAAVVVVGLAMFVGVLPGDVSFALTLVPALIAAGVIVVVSLSPQLLRKFGAPLAQGAADDWPGRARKGIRKGLVAAADGVELAKSLIRGHSFGVIVGSFSYMAFDIAALGFAFAAIGPVPTFGVLVLGYLIGQLGNLIPVPGGIGGTEGALVGIFALFHVNVPLAAAAVLIYRFFQLVIPALLGAPAFVMLRRRLIREDQPAMVCAPLAAEVVKLPARS